MFMRFAPVRLPLLQAYCCCCCRWCCCCAAAATAAVCCCSCSCYRVGAPPGPNPLFFEERYIYLTPPKQASRAPKPCALANESDSIPAQTHQLWDSLMHVRNLHCACCQRAFENLCVGTWRSELARCLENRCGTEKSARPITAEGSDILDTFPPKNALRHKLLVEIFMVRISSIKSILRVCELLYFPPVYIWYYYYTRAAWFLVIPVIFIYWFLDFFVCMYVPGID